jgi:voltage-gated potassium channel
MGLILSRRANAGDAFAHGVGRFEELQIAVALVTGSTMVGLTDDDVNLHLTIYSR